MTSLDEQFVSDLIEQTVSSYNGALFVQSLIQSLDLDTQMLPKKLHKLIMRQIPKELAITVTYFEFIASGLIESIQYEHSAHIQILLLAILAITKQKLANSVQESAPSAEIQHLVISKLENHVSKSIWSSVIIQFEIVIEEEEALKLVSDLIDQEDRAAAIKLATRAKLQAKVDVEGLIHPLLSKGSYDLVIPFLAGSPDRTIQIKVIRDIAFKVNNLNNAFKALKACGFSLQDFPDIVNQMKKNSLFFLMKKGNLRDFYQDVITADDIGNQEFLLKQLIKNECWEDLVELGAVFSSASRRIPRFDQIYGQARAWTEDRMEVEEAVRYLSLEVNAVFVDNDELFQKASKLILQSNSVGVDVESRPSVITSDLDVESKGDQKRGLATIQLAVSNAAFVFGVPEMLASSSRTAFQDFLQTMFSDASIVKLGYGIQGDLKSIQKHVGIQLVSKSVIDFDKVHRKISEAYQSKVEMDLQGKAIHKGLSRLCEEVLGKPLNKKEQISDWLRRPLRGSQLKYAALDAHCLVKIYQQILEKHADLFD